MTNKLANTAQQNMAIRLMRVLRYNKTRNERVLALMPDKQKHLYSVIPFLLHVNHPAFPGYIADKDAPYGLFHYSFKSQLENDLQPIYHESQPLKKTLKECWPTNRWIDSLMLMGSVGTIAQSNNSDFDYWVCINQSVFEDKQLILLQQKLHMIEAWAWQNYHLEVHFFISDIKDVKNNKFGQADGESSGSAQAIFLKSEFYTTHIAVAGKAPFWWLMPDNTSQTQYQALIGQLKADETPDPKFFMDLGNVEHLDAGELFGAAIWQITKAIDSPFKSVLKMAKLEVFLDDIEHRKPLCNILRSQVHKGVQAPGGLEGIDPYALMFDQLTEFYEQHKHPKIVQLLRTCLYLKCGCHLSQLSQTEDLNFKQKVIVDYVKRWDWNDERIHYFDHFSKWSYKAKFEFSRQIHSFLIKCYRRISNGIERHQQRVNDQDMTVLGRRIDAFYSNKPNKVESVRSAFGNELYTKVISICADLDTKLQREWYIYSGNQISKEYAKLEKVLLNESHSPIDLVIWAVTNKIIDQKTKILLGYKTAPVTEEDLQLLSKHCCNLFPPIKINDLPREDLLASARITHCMVVANFESRRLKAEIETLRIVYTTSWGEHYVLSSFEQLAEIKPALTNKQQPVELYMLCSDGDHKQKLQQDLEKRSGIRGWKQL